MRCRSRTACSHDEGLDVKLRSRGALSLVEPFGKNRHRDRDAEGPDRVGDALAMDMNRDIDRAPKRNNAGFRQDRSQIA